MADQQNGTGASGGALNLAALAGRDEDLGSAGGSSGGGTTAGRGEPSGGTLDGTGDTPAGASGNPVAAEAAALGSVDGSLADAVRAANSVQGSTGPCCQSNANRSPHAPLRSSSAVVA